VLVVVAVIVVVVLVVVASSSSDSSSGSTSTDSSGGRGTIDHALLVVEDNVWLPQILCWNVELVDTIVLPGVPPQGVIYPLLCTGYQQINQ